MWWIWNIFLIITINVLESQSIQNSRSTGIRFSPPVPFIQSIPIRNQQQILFKDVGFTRNFRQVSGSNSFNFDWENGLREATTQALIKEGSRDVNLRKHIFSAPILGREEKATPFGDIAVLARGQLYVTPRGYLFNQDPYQNDCDGCHNEYARNEIWKPKNLGQLMALWTVRRIRHRSATENSLPRFEIEFTVSPINHNHRVQGQISEGYFNYAIPGHVFLMKGDNQQSMENHYFAEKEGTLIAQSLEGRKYILQNFPGILPPPPAYNEVHPPPPEYDHVKQTVATPQSTTELLTDETLSPDEEKKIYQALLDILHKKTSTIQPQVTKSTIQEPPNTPTTQISATTLVQLPSGQLVPITELSSPFITRTTQGFVSVRFPDTTEPQMVYTTAPKVPPQKMSTTKPSTTYKYVPQGFKPPSHTSVPKVPPQKISTAKPSTTYKHVPQSTNHQTTARPKTTFHFFSAAEDNEDVSVPTSKKPTSAQFLLDTNIAQSLNTATTIKQSTAGKKTPEIHFSTSQLPTTIFIPATFETSKIPEETTQEIQFSTVGSISTSQNPISSNQYSPTTFKRPTGTTSSRVLTTLHTEPSYQKISTTESTESFQTSTIEIHKEITSTVTTESTKVPHSTTAPPPTDNLVETTLGVTKIMSTITNDTPGTIFIVSEPSSEENANTQTEESTTSTLKHIITTIGRDGTVSVKTTNLPDKTKKYKAKITTEKSNFLLQTDLGPSKVPFYKDASKDYYADDIFGTTQQSVTKPSKIVRKPYTVSDVELALFGNDRHTRNYRKSRKFKYLKKNLSRDNNTSTEKIKYSSSYVSTEPTVIKTTQQTEIKTAEQTDIKTTSLLPYTSQSVLTSISYKVNKRKTRILKNKVPLETTTQSIITTTAASENITDKYHKKNNSQSEFDELASNLLGQAKAIEILEQTTPVTTVKTSKYMRRRSYVRKRPND